MALPKQGASVTSASGQIVNLYIPHNQRPPGVETERPISIPRPPSGVNFREIETCELQDPF